MAKFFKKITTKGTILIFDIHVVNFPFLDGDVPLSASYGVYFSQLIRFARVCSLVEEFNRRNQIITEKLLKQAYLCFT